jgi:hypothetical protein
MDMVVNLEAVVAGLLLLVTSELLGLFVALLEFLEYREGWRFGI